MKFEELKKRMRKQHYEFVGDHSAVQVCRWTKKSLKNEGVCYKEKFYGIDAHKCCQMTPWLGCPNKCIHCWRPIEFEFELEGKINSPKEIIDGCIEAQRKLLQGFKIDPHSKKKQLSKADQKKYLEAQEPMQFAISLSGEPTVYKHLAGLIKELRKRGKTSFLVTNGLYPEKLKELEKKKSLPTQLYVSVNSPNEKLYQKFHRSVKKDAWKRLMKTLEFLKKIKGKTRTVFRLNLVRKINMKPEHAREFAELIKMSQPMFIEVKGYMSVGFARERLGYDMMPTHNEIKDYAKKILEELERINEKDYKILDEKKESCVLVLGKDKKELKIKKSEM